MATLKEIRNRIRSVKSTRQITKAMEMVAAAKLRRAQQRATEARPYADHMNAMLSSLAEAATGEISHPYFEQREIRRRTLVLVTSDRGLCGSFNTALIRAANNWLKDFDHRSVELVLIGKRGFDFFRKRNYMIAANYQDWGGQLDYDTAKSIVSFLTTRFTQGNTDHVTILYPRFINTARNETTIEDYLPISKPQTSAALSSSRKEYIFEPSPEQIYSSLLPSYALTRLVTALLDSFASEHGARMVAMSNATKNAGEMINQLTLKYNKARQGQITKELLEIVGGAEALKG